MLRVVTPTGYVSVPAPQKETLCTRQSLHSFLRYTWKPPGCSSLCGSACADSLCMESNPCCVLFSAWFLVMSMADPTAWVSFISWWVLRLLTLGLVTAPAVSTEHRCYLDIPFPCVDSMFGSHGHLLLS